MVEQIFTAMNTAYDCAYFAPDARFAPFILGRYFTDKPMGWFVELPPLT
ncbi:hypothetical protein [Streptomyces sp. NPDC049881]